ncbi:hypothetical protein JCM6882_002670 [Rhodosporidiobolus microsporus]
MESPGCVEPTDRLSTLPVELLEWIFELAYEDKKHTTTGAISRALLPSNRRERFKQVVVKGVEQLVRFRELVEGCPHLRALVELLVFGDCDSDTQGQPPHPTSEQMQRLFTLLTRIRRVDLRHNCNTLHEFVLSPASVGAFPTFLGTLTLRPLECDLSRLGNLNAFPSMRRLILKMEDFLNPLPTPHVPHARGEGIFDHSTLFNNLRQLPSLTSLTFNRGAVVAISDLLSFISGPLRHPSLELLVLKMVRLGRRGWRILEDGKGDLHPRHEQARGHVGPDWVVPEFTDPDERFSTSGVEALIDAGQKSEVEVFGSAVDGIDVYREWRAEAVECLLVFGREQGHYGELREFVGTEAAEKLLKERGFKEDE